MFNSFHQFSISQHPIGTKWELLKGLTKISKLLFLSSALCQWSSTLISPVSIIDHSLSFDRPKNHWRILLILLRENEIFRKKFRSFQLESIDFEERNSLINVIFLDQFNSNMKMIIWNLKISRTTSNMMIKNFIDQCFRKKIHRWLIEFHCSWRITLIRCLFYFAFWEHLSNGLFSSMINDLIKKSTSIFSIDWMDLEMTHSWSLSTHYWSPTWSDPVHWSVIDRNVLWPRQILSKINKKPSFHLTKSSWIRNQRSVWSAIRRRHRSSFSILANLR